MWRSAYFIFLADFFLHIEWHFMKLVNLWTISNLIKKTMFEMPLILFWTKYFKNHWPVFNKIPETMLESIPCLIWFINLFNRDALDWKNNLLFTTQNVFLKRILRICNWTFPKAGHQYVKLPFVRVWVPQGHAFGTVALNYLWRSNIFLFFKTLCFCVRVNLLSLMIN